MFWVADALEAEARLAVAQRADVTVVALCGRAEQSEEPTKQRPTYIVGFVLPHAIFIPGDQFIQIGHDVIILGIDFCHHI